jgi:hypothetical protein
MRETQVGMSEVANTEFLKLGQLHRFWDTSTNLLSSFAKALKRKLVFFGEGGGGALERAGT